MISNRLLNVRALSIEPHIINITQDIQLCDANNILDNYQHHDNIAHEVLIWIQLLIPILYKKMVHFQRKNSLSINCKPIVTISPKYKILMNHHIYLVYL